MLNTGIIMETLSAEDAAKAGKEEEESELAILLLPFDV